MKSMAKRIFLFVAVNILVITTISFILSIFHIQPYLDERGLNYSALMAFCLIWGMGGAFISLGLSKMMAKWMMGVEVIDPATARGQERELLETVYRIAKNAGLDKMPEVGIYSSPEVNAFATGPSRSRSLVAVSSGLLSRMTTSEVEAVLGHEVSHIANGDMVTMTLLQGVINAFVMFLARVLAYAVIKATSKQENNGEVSSSWMYTLLVIVFQLVFMVLGTLVVAAFSRWREFRADAGSARLVGRDKMIQALRALEKTTQIRDPHAAQPAFEAMKISDGKSVWRYFASHPPLETRIERLQKGIL
jgi:heat shock protein HtpX